MQPAALTGALTREISTYHGVEAAKGRIIGDGRDPEIVLTVTPAPAADLHALHQPHRNRSPRPRPAGASAKPTLPIQLDLGVSRR